MTPNEQPFMLPSIVVTRTDFLQLINELERIDDDLTTTAVRAKAGAPASQSVAMSDMARTFIDVNKVAIDDGTARTQLVQSLRALKDKLPITHLTFATRADQQSLSQLVEWLRESVHPMSLLTIGLQPDLISGVYVRTPNRVYDLSVRQKLSEGRHLLVEAVEAISAGR